MNFKGRLLAVDDDREMRELFSDFLTREGYQVNTASSAAEGLTILREDQSSFNPFDLVITDLKMANIDGMQFLKTLKQEMPDLPVILATGFGSIDTAIEAMRNGAFHYLVKPFKLTEVILNVERAIEKRRLTLENNLLKTQIQKDYRLENIVGKSEPMQALFDLIKRVAPSTANILIHGESGTGKEMVARAIHNLSPRKDKPFVAINCTAIPETLLESELFGHAKGSFTGATQRKKGLIEEASGGTLFLDEIGDMSSSLQAKLLRVLQEKNIRPVGDTQSIDVDVRIVAATHKDLKTGIKQGTFREDLYYRLAVIPIEIPSLRHRPEDIPLLADHFLKKYSARSNGTSRVKGLSKAALSKLMRFHWPGNVRELENLIERLTILAPGSVIDDKDFTDPSLESPQDAIKKMTDGFPTLTELEKLYMRLVLEKTNGRKERAAQILGINRRTLYRKEREYGFVATSEPLDKELVLENSPSGIANA